MGECERLNEKILSNFIFTVVKLNHIMHLIKNVTRAWQEQNKIIVLCFKIWFIKHIN